MLNKKLIGNFFGIGVIATSLFITSLTANALTTDISVEEMQENEEFCEFYDVEMSNDPDFIKEVQAMLEERNGNNPEKEVESHSGGVNQVGKKCDPNFANNKINSTANNKKRNYSELVWKAWKYKKDIDLDSNGGPGVYPNNIKNSNRTKLVTTG